MNWVWAILAYIGALILCLSLMSLWVWFHSPSEEEAFREERGRAAWADLQMAFVKALHIDQAAEMIDTWLVGLCHKKEG